MIIELTHPFLIECDSPEKLFRKKYDKPEKLLKNGKLESIDLFNLKEEDHVSCKEPEKGEPVSDMFAEEEK
jgi:hypothetical protein